MFDINNIQYNPTTKQYICCCQCDSSQDAKYICAKYIMLARTFDTVGEIYSRGSTAIIGTSNPKAAVTIANYINANYFMLPLDVYVFYGSSRKGLPSRWCVGFNCLPQQVQKLIAILNTQGPLVNADNNPQNWQDKSGNSYSIVMHTGVMEPELTEDALKLLDQMVSICLNTIQNTTFRKSKVNPI